MKHREDETEESMDKRNTVEQQAILLPVLLGIGFALLCIGGLILLQIVKVG